jgi:hypothetical protein
VCSARCCEHQVRSDDAFSPQILRTDDLAQTPVTMHVGSKRKVMTAFALESGEVGKWDVEALGDPLLAFPEFIESNCGLPMLIHYDVP